MDEILMTIVVALEEIKDELRKLREVIAQGKDDGR